MQADSLMVGGTFIRLFLRTCRPNLAVTFQAEMNLQMYALPEGVPVILDASWEDGQNDIFSHGRNCGVLPSSHQDLTTVVVYWLGCQ